MPNKEAAAKQRKRLPTEGDGVTPRTSPANKAKARGERKGLPSKGSIKTASMRPLNESKLIVVFFVDC